MCDKRPYTKQEARQVIAICRAERNRHKQPKRAYFCPECEVWHLTSVKTFHTRFKRFHYNRKFYSP